MPQLNNIHDKSIDVSQHDKFSWKTFLSATEIRALEFPIDSLSIADLAGYVDYLRSVGEPYQNHRHQLWRKISRPFSAAVNGFVSIIVCFWPRIVR